MQFENVDAIIDEIDDAICALFERRLSVCAETALQKAESGLATARGAKRERDIVSRLTANQTDEMALYTKSLFSAVFDLSRSYESAALKFDSEIAERIERALSVTPKIFPRRSVVACQGEEGAYSQFACEKIFARPDIKYFANFDDVFGAVESGACSYGILPTENSLHGSVAEVYDLMRKYNFYISRCVKMKINHAFLVKNGAVLPGIKTVYSHSQALSQCGEFLKTLSGIEVTDCKNTATAARIVAESGDDSCAAISNYRCAELYNLSVLKDDIQNNANNYTRFICISKEMEIYPGADKMSVMFTVPHKPGALYAIISKFAALGVNLTKLESRPIPERDFEFVFYTELEASVYSKEVINLISELDASPETFVFLGAYSEI